ncbi:MAG TPA: sulfite exporter TauE/SafE family protein, partial [Actinomycetales bacterium]
SGIVLVGVLASVGSARLVPRVVEAYLAFGTGVLVVGLGLWMLWTQRELLALAMGEPAGAAGDSGPSRHAHDHAHEHAHGHGPGHHHHHHGEEAGWHSHGWGTRHSHRLDVVTDDRRRPSLAVLLTLGIVGGILPDPTALAILLASLSSGKVLLGLATVVVFSLGFAATLVAVGVVAARVGERVLEWLSSLWVVRVQIATTLLILGMGLVLTVNAAYKLGAALPPS